MVPHMEPLCKRHSTQPTLLTQRALAAFFAIALRLVGESLWLRVLSFSDRHVGRALQRQRLS